MVLSLLLLITATCCDPFIVCATADEFCLPFSFSMLSATGDVADIPVSEIDLYLFSVMPSCKVGGRGLCTSSSFRVAFGSCLFYDDLFSSNSRRCFMVNLAVIAFNGNNAMIIEKSKRLTLSAFIFMTYP